MAKLMKCVDCGKKISVRAESCPHCGAPVDAAASAPRHYSLSGLLSFLLIAACVVLAVGTYEEHLLFSIFSIVVAVVLIKPVRMLIASKTFKPKIASPVIYIVFASLWMFWLFNIANSSSDYQTKPSTTSTTKDRSVAAPVPIEQTKPDSAAEANKPNQTIQPRDVWVTSDRLPRRTCPDARCGVVGTYFFREKATVLEERGDWARVTKYYDASCRNGVSDYVDSGNAKCESANGIEDSQFAEWVVKANLASDRPPDPAARAKGNYELVSGSDDYRVYKDVFAKAATELIASGRCTAAEFKEMGGWVKSMTHKDKPVYFLYCGGFNKVYLDASSGKVIN